MREPTMKDLVAYVCDIQPELDPPAAASLLRLDENLKVWIAQRWRERRVTSQALLDLHLDRVGATA